MQVPKVVPPNIWTFSKWDGGHNYWNLTNRSSTTPSGTFKFALSYQGNLLNVITELAQPISKRYHPYLSLNWSIHHLDYTTYIRIPYRQNDGFTLSHLQRGAQNFLDVDTLDPRLVPTICGTFWREMFHPS